jgi:hypothetical protein
VFSDYTGALQDLLVLQAYSHIHADVYTASVDSTATACNDDDNDTIYTAGMQGHRK